jgi:TonB family protein
MKALRIPEPCKEDFSKMTPVENGRYCDVCSKTVIDFRNYSDSELLDFFAKKDPAQRVCGIVKKAQLNHILIEIPAEKLFARKLPRWQKFLVCLVVCFSSLLIACNEEHGEQARMIKVALTVPGTDLSKATGNRKTEMDLPVTKPTCNSSGWIDDVAGALEIDEVVEAPVIDEPVFPEIPDEMGDITVGAVVDIMPEFPGGEQVLLDYLSNNLKYPAYERENDIEGTVYVGFTIDELGGVINPKILRSVPGSVNFDAEVLRVIKNMPRWKPAKQNGKPVKATYSLPVRFRIQ